METKTASALHPLTDFRGGMLKEYRSDSKILSGSYGEILMITVVELLRK